MADSGKLDIAGSLYTAEYRETHIVGKKQHAKDLTGTGSCFDATRMSPVRAGTQPHRPAPSKQSEPQWCRATMSYKFPAQKPDSHDYLCKGEGQHIKRGGSAASRPAAPSKAGAYTQRANPPNSAFRRAYERGELPIAVDHRSFKNTIKWKADVSTLDLHHYLPLFFDGIRERQDPFRFLAIKGSEDLLAADAARVLPVIPQLIIPLKTALNTRDPAVMCTALQLLQKLVLCGDLVGQALVPYYRQLLPVLNQYRNSNKNIGDGIDYGQQHHDCLGDLISETLELLEQRGGPDAFINIKYLVPQYESCVHAS